MLHKSRNLWTGAHSLAADARIIMGDDVAALLRLWREKRGETESEDLSGNLIVQLGSRDRGAQPELVSTHRPGGH